MADKELAWCTTTLQSFTLNEDMTDMAILIRGLSNRREIQEFLVDLLGEEKVKTQKVQRFIAECMERQQLKPDEVVYRKEKFSEIAQKNVVPSFETILSVAPDSAKKKKKSPKKTHYVKLYSDRDYTNVLLPGRNICHCLSQRHKLINNCISCGRIVCEQEGEGPCLFCGGLVATPENQAFIMSQSKKGREIERKLWDNKPRNFKPISFQPLEEQNFTQSDAYIKAVEHKRKLLEYDRTNIHRSKVLDDEADYFQNTRWLSKNEKVTVKKKADERAEMVHASRRNAKLTLDFAGRKIIEDESATMNTEIGVVYENRAGESEERSDGLDNFEPVFINREDHCDPQYLKTSKTVTNTNKAAIRNQDKDFQLLRDEGMVLTMHQPWAGFLVHGIKKLEGRSWYSTHRGKLWIHSAGKQPSTVEINELESHYREIRGNDVRFPEYYPSSALIGHVFVEDVVEQYENEEENSSNYLFVCSNPVALPVPVKCKGQHKIWKMPKSLLETVSSQL